MSASEQPLDAFPPYVTTPEEQRRWGLAKRAAEEMFRDLEPTQRAEQVWSATRALYTSDVPTGDPSETIPG